MKTIVFIGSQKSGSSREAIKAADRLGYYTVLLTDRPTFIEKRTEFPDVHLMQLCDLNNMDELRNIIGRLQMKALDISSIISFVDPYCHTACVLAEEFGINYFSTKAIGNMLDKILSRHILSNSPYVPYFDVLTDASRPQKKTIEKYLPLIMKSPNSTGSKDVFKVTSYKEYKDTMNKLFTKYPKEPILVEEFLDGPQYLVETAVYEGKLRIIAVFKQEITFNQRFIITGYDLMLDLQGSFFNSLKTAVTDIVNAHEMEHGACHLEIRYVKNQWKLIEINPRISGGAMNKIIETGYGINLVEQTILMALNKVPNFEPKFKKHTFTQYSIVSEAGILEKVTGRNKAIKSEGVEQVYIKPRKGSLLTPPLSMGNRYAYVIATGETEEKARTNAKYASSIIKFWLKPVPEEDKDETRENTVSADVSACELTHLNFKNYLDTNYKGFTATRRDITNVDKYLDWYRTSLKGEFKSLKREDVLKYRDYLKDSLSFTDKTVNSKLYSLRKFNQFLISQGIQEAVVIDKEDMIYDLNKDNTIQNETYTVDGLKECK